MLFRTECLRLATIDHIVVLLRVDTLHTCVPIGYQVMLYCLPASSAYDSDVSLMYLLQLLQLASVEPVDEVLLPPCQDLDLLDEYIGTEQVGTELVGSMEYHTGLH